MAYTSDYLSRADERLSEIDNETCAVSLINNLPFYYDRKTILDIAVALEDSIESKQIYKVINEDLTEYVTRLVAYTRRKWSDSADNNMSLVNKTLFDIRRLVLNLKDIMTASYVSNLALDRAVTVAIYDFTLVISTKAPHRYDGHFFDKVLEQFLYLTLKDDLKEIYPQAHIHGLKAVSRGWLSTKDYLEQSFIPLEYSPNNKVSRNDTSMKNLGVVLPLGQELYFSYEFLSDLLSYTRENCLHKIDAKLIQMEIDYDNKEPWTIVPDYEKAGYGRDFEGELFKWSLILQERIPVTHSFDVAELRFLVNEIKNSTSVPKKILHFMHKGNGARLFSWMLVNLAHLPNVVGLGMDTVTFLKQNLTVIEPKLPVNQVENMYLEGSFFLRLEDF